MTNAHIEMTQVTLAAAHSNRAFCGAVSCLVCCPPFCTRGIHSYAVHVALCALTRQDSGRHGDYVWKSRRLHHDAQRLELVCPPFSFSTALSLRTQLKRVQANISNRRRRTSDLFAMVTSDSPFVKRRITSARFSSVKAFFCPMVAF